MKAKNLLFVSFLLLAAIALPFSGCTKQAEKSEALPNPIVQRASSADIQTALGFTFEALPENITNVTFTTIADTTAQVDFTSDDQTYNARKAKNTNQDITGVYIKFANSQTITDANGNAVLYQYNDGAEGLSTWFNTDFSYSIYCPAGFNLTAMQSMVNTIK